jgi:anti-sigma factor RsiW
MSKTSPLDEGERADLVAYLDGELKGAAARTIEQRLAREPAVRAEADALRRAWEMLDFLPLPEPSEQFSNRTLQRVAPVTVQVAAAATTPHRWRPRALAAAWAAAAAVALVAGYAATRVAAPVEPGESELVRDLGVIEKMRLYEAAEDLELVRDLDAPDLFGDDSIGT